MRRAFEVEVADDGLAALPMMSKQHFDVVVLDIKMPGMDGISVLGEIKRRYPAIQVIMLGAFLSRYGSGVFGRRRLCSSSQTLPGAEVGGCDRRRRGRARGAIGIEGLTVKSDGVAAAMHLIALQSSGSGVSSPPPVNSSIIPMGISCVSGHVPGPGPPARW